MNRCLRLDCFLYAALIAGIGACGHGEDPRGSSTGVTGGSSASSISSMSASSAASGSGGPDCNDFRTKLKGCDDCLSAKCCDEVEACQSNKACSTCFTTYEYTPCAGLDSADNLAVCASNQCGNPCVGAF